MQNADVPVTRPTPDPDATISPPLPFSLAAVLDQRKLLAGRIEELLENYPLRRS